jgi:hypothetical protein
MSAAALTPADLLTLLRDGLATWAATNKGSLHIANDAFHVDQLLEESPAGFRIIVWWGGDQPAGDEPHAGIVTNNLRVVLSMGRGMAKDKSTHLVIGRAGQKALYELVSECRARVRAIEFSDPDDEISGVWPEYMGTAALVAPGGLPLDAYELSFALTTVVEAEAATSESQSDATSLSEHGKTAIPAGAGTLAVTFEVVKDGDYHFTELLCKAPAGASEVVSVWSIVEATADGFTIALSAAPQLAGHQLWWTVKV